MGMKRSGLALRLLVGGLLLEGRWGDRGEGVGKGGGEVRYITLFAFFLWGRWSPSPNLGLLNRAVERWWPLMHSLLRERWRKAYDL